MADTLSTGVSGLMAFQRALDVTSHNIVNAGTAGYSRQVVDFASRGADQVGGVWVGRGASANNIRRIYDQVLTEQARSANTSLQQLDTFASYADRLDRLFSDPKTGVSTSLQQFNNTIQTLANSPNSGTTRQLVLSQAQSLVARLQSFHSTVNSMSDQSNSQLRTEAGQINILANGVASLNEQIVAAKGSAQGPPNDLLDQRDALLSELGSHVGFTTLAEDNGAVTVTIGSGQLLVRNNVVNTLTVAPSPQDPSAQRLMLGGATALTDVTGIVAGGSVGGLLQLQSSLLTAARNSLGRVAVSLATVANQQQAAGLDLNGNFGGPLFALPAPTVVSSAANTGYASATATITDLSALTSADYSLQYQSAGWSLIRCDTGAVVPMTGTGTAEDPFRADGLAIVRSGAPNVGDSMLIRPTHDVIPGLRVLISSPDLIAAASPLVTTAEPGNSGGATISDGVVPVPGNWVRGKYTLSFTDASSWQVVDAASNVVASGPYSSGGTISFNGMEVSVSGTPAAGDEFVIADNSSGGGDSRNAQALSRALTGGLLASGTLSITDAAGAMVGDIGLQSSQAQAARDAQSTVFDDANNALSNATGVNIDEEASNLLRYQQAYQAAARVIAASDSMFQSLLDAIK